MTDANEAREVLPILFLGQDPRFVEKPETREQQVLGRTRDFRPGLAPQAHPIETQYMAASRAGRPLDMGPHAPQAKNEDAEEAAALERYKAALAAGLSDHEAREEGWPSDSDPKVSSVTEAAPDSSGDSPTLKSDDSEVSAPAVRAKNDPQLIPPAI